MSLRLHETYCSSQVLKPWRLDQETSKEKLFIEAEQKLDRFSTPLYKFRQKHIYQDLMNEARQILDKSRIYRDLGNHNFQIWFSAQADVYV